MKIRITKRVKAELLPNPDSTRINLTTCEIGQVLQDHEISDFMLKLLIRSGKAVAV